MKLDNIKWYPRLYNVIIAPVVVFSFVLSWILFPLCYIILGGDWTVIVCEKIFDMFILPKNAGW